MDVNMPLMDGLQATQEIKKIDPSPIIIINTAYNERSDLNLAL
jgi:CheY-like chemotaxis protein